MTKYIIHAAFAAVLGLTPVALPQIMWGTPDHLRLARTESAPVAPVPYCPTCGDDLTGDFCSCDEMMLELYEDAKTYTRKVCEDTDFAPKPAFSVQKNHEGKLVFFVDLPAPETDAECAEMDSILEQLNARYGERLECVISNGAVSVCYFVS